MKMKWSYTEGSAIGFAQPPLFVRLIIGVYIA